MSTKMLYRIHGDHEPGVTKVVLDGYNVEAKIFDRGEKPEGWVSAASILQFLADELPDSDTADDEQQDDAGGHEAQVDDDESDVDESADQVDETAGLVETVSDFDKMKAGLADIDEKEAKLKVDEWAAARSVKLDRRKSLPVMLETLEKALADG